jgi:peptidyl-Asp metalloendopeptidase
VNRVGSAFTTSGQIIYTEPNPQWRILAAADANGDGRSDLFWRAESTGQIYLMLMNGPAITSGGLVYAEPDLLWQPVAIGDYDGNGRSDLLWRNELTGQVYLMLLDGFSVAGGAVVHTEPNPAWGILGWGMARDD